MITKIRYNWRQVGNVNEELGEDYEAATVNEIDTNYRLKVVKIIKNESDKAYNIVYENGDVLTVYNPNTVYSTNK